MSAQLVRRPLVDRAQFLWLGMCSRQRLKGSYVIQTADITWICPILLQSMDQQFSSITRRQLHPTFALLCALCALIDQCLSFDTTNHRGQDKIKHAKLSV